MAWTEEKVELAKTLWSEGWSATHIAGQLGVGFSRNAVIGKIHRLGLHRSHKTDQPPAKPKPAKPKAAKAPAGKRIFLMKPANRLLPPERVHVPGPVSLAPSLDLTIFQLTDRTCKFITKPVHYCGHPVKDGTSYCAGHCEIVYMPVQPRKSA